MDPSLNRDLALIAVSSATGFVLGLFGETLKHFLMARGRRKSFAKAIVQELQEAKLRLVLLALTIRKRQGTVDTAILEKVRDVLGSSKELSRVEGVLDFINKALALDEDRRTEILAPFVRPQGSGLSLKTLETSFLISNIEQVSDLKVCEQNAIHNFLNQLSIFNQEVAYTMEMHTMTFSVQGDNHTIVIMEIHRRHTNLAVVSIDTVDRIIAIETIFSGYLD